MATTGDDKKERVIHTRVSETLEQELKERATELGVSVSNLVRNVLQNAFGLVADVMADSASVARSAHGVRRSSEPASGTPDTAAPPVPAAAAASPAAAAPGPVIGWQRIVLAVNALCSRCNDILPRGTDAAIGITDGGARPILCLRCLEETRHDADGTRRVPGDG
jgi:hypothetical protein